MAEHNLKIRDKYFFEIRAGFKVFEIRYNDRDYQKGDLLIFERGNVKIICRVNYILYYREFTQGLKPNYCIMSIELIDDQVIGIKPRI